MTDVDASAPPEDADVGLPKWLEEMMEPGVGSGVFLTLKLSLIGLVTTLCIMLSFVEDSTVRMHLKIFLSMALLLTVLVIWFINELQKADPPEKEEDPKQELHAI